VQRAFYRLPVQRKLKQNWTDTSVVCRMVIGKGKKEGKGRKRGGKEKEGDQQRGD